MIARFTGLPSQCAAGGGMKRADIHQASSTLESMRYSAEQKAEVHATLETILDRLDGMPRAPDGWEETCLVLALNFLESGLYDRAHKELEDCVLPAGERSPWREHQINRNPRRYSVGRLRARLAGVKAAIG
ncbi:MAG: hypothetical protein A3D94_13625 [Alphaproteobacteria bacterium RIFCSPHIGHO2_12_FULL_66_14]|jgi:hypothetical protein|nr:MAG: hypothetical protein A3D94_13625 [Alphaproteobacteria bacterium RIFCSPHIGHO2_12_FULL_66_14]